MQRPQVVGKGSREDIANQSAPLVPRGHNDVIIQLLFMSRDPDDVINPARFYK